MYCSIHNQYHYITYNLTSLKITDFSQVDAFVQEFSGMRKMMMKNLKVIFRLLILAFLNFTAYLSLSFHLSFSVFSQTLRLSLYLPIFLSSYNSLSLSLPLSLFSLSLSPPSLSPSLPLSLFPLYLITKGMDMNAMEADPNAPMQTMKAKQEQERKDRKVKPTRGGGGGFGAR